MDPENALNISQNIFFSSFFLLSSILSLEESQLKHTHRKRLLWHFQTNALGKVPGPPICTTMCAAMPGFAETRRHRSSFFAAHPPLPFLHILLDFENPLGSLHLNSAGTLSTIPPTGFPFSLL